MIDRRSVLIGGIALGSVAAARPPIRVVRGGSIAEGLATARRLGVRVITIDAGVYREKLTIDLAGVTLRATGPGAVLTYDAGAALPGPDGRNWGTSGSATLTIRAADVTIDGMTIRNDHPYPQQPMQAVALAVQAGGDRCRLRRCRIEGYQDTLLLQATSRVSDCHISGNVDFIFGGAAAWIERCDIVSRPTQSGAPGFVAAPSTPACQAFGLVFDRCRLLREDGVRDGSVFLGRPWRAGGNMALLGQASFLRCRMDAHIAAEGWTWMGYRDPAGVQRQLTPLEARLYEADSRGPGAVAAPTRRTDTRRPTADRVLASGGSCR
ncbi:pectinesterase family protein [Sphingomonas sp. CFBP 13720]|uniref:pectinesterase family protein n=1 Tax=Sphingomonas sp. CFBP 13720 TaxID=2775302 RepID=UPI00177DCF81|nr:pectinesterase family protein [Sphingomonas sp. CFBP 13720]MBD8679415.1 hypothetical protein [Sphingomonas sp. CFBP 13720]